ncbi:MAG: HEAT repeat domain-containing protein [Vicinamibacteria bacterium]|nr:HEAT repeat domain-containing protein [Vicinamibacteria bacterium]
MMVRLPFALSALLLSLSPATRSEKLTRILILEESRADDAGELARYLTDSDAGVRRRAALAAGRAGNSGLMTALFGMLNDRKVEMRRMAVFSLGLLGERDAEQRLSMALNDGDPIVRGRAAEALARLGARSQAVEIANMVLKALPEGAPKVTVRGDDPGNPEDPWIELRLGLFALAHLGDVNAAEGVLLKDGEPRFDWWAATYAASRIASPSLKPFLTTAAGSSDPMSRFYAARGLGTLADPSTLVQIESLIGDRNGSVVVQALRALSRFPGERSVAVAEEALESSDPGIIEAALTALARLPTPSGMLARIVARVGHADPGIRAAALRALAHTDRERLALVLSGLDPDPAWSVHDALAEALGDIGDEMSLGILHAMLADSEPYALPAILGALARAEGRNASVILRRYVDHPDFAVRAAAVHGLARVGDSRDNDALRSSYERALGDVEPDARLAALSAIGERYDAAGEEVLRNAFRSDPTQGVRLHAGQILAEKGQGGPRVAFSGSIHPHLDYRIWMAPYMPRPETPLYTPRALIHTRKGVIEIHLNILEAPLACASFVRLARRGFYNDLVFDTVISGEIVFSGCPRGDGRGGAGVVLPSEPGLRPFGRGAMGLAEAQRDMGGSRFFITLTPMPERDGRNTLMGWVADGVETVEKIRPGDKISWIEVWDGR